MSTSPSWFDQEKFSRLVKKVGATTKSGSASPAPTLPASSPSATTSTGPVQLPPAPLAPEPEPEPEPEPVAPAPEPTAPRAAAPAPVSSIPKPAAGTALFTFKPAARGELKPKTQSVPQPAAKAPSTPAPEPVPASTLPSPAPSAPRVYLTPPPVEEPEPLEVEEPVAEAPEPEPEPAPKVVEKPKFSFNFSKLKPETRSEEKAPAPTPPGLPPVEEKKPKFTFDLPESELPAKPGPPALPASKADTAADLHVVEQPHIAKKSTVTSTLQRLPRIMPGGSKPPAPPTQTRSVSALSRRTSTLPGVRPLTEPLLSVERTEAPIRASEVAETPAPAATPPPLEFAPIPKSPTVNLAGFAKETKSMPPPLTRQVTKPAETFETWETPAAAPDESGAYLEQIAQLTAERDNLAARIGELSSAAQERDEALLEAVTLRSQLANAEAAALGQGNPAASSDEIALVTGERDAARRDYAELRLQYEKLKQDQVKLKNNHAAAMAGLQKQVEAGGTAQGAPPEREDFIDTLKQELKNLQLQVVQAKEEASASQRGLALSQKALQETREALREASEGKGMFENLKKERSTLVQQNMLLQAQNDQVARELSALKAKVGAR